MVVKEGGGRRGVRKLVASVKITIKFYNRYPWMFEDFCLKLILVEYSYYITLRGI